MKPIAPFEIDTMLSSDSLVILEPNSDKFFITTKDEKLTPFNTAVLNSRGIIKYNGNPAPGVVGQVNILTGSNCSLSNLDASYKSTILNPNTKSIVNHTLIEEFMLENNGSNTPVLIDDCSVTTGWSAHKGTSTGLTVDGGVKFTGVGDTNLLVMKKSIAMLLNGKHFVKFTITPSITTTLYFALGSTQTRSWTSRNFPVTANVPTTFILPVLGTIGTVGLAASFDGGYVTTSGTTIYIGMATPDNTTQCSFTVSSIYSEMFKYVTFGCKVPDNLLIGPVSSKYDVELSTWTGTGYIQSLYHNVPNNAYIGRADGMYFGDGSKIKSLFTLNDYSSIMAAYKKGKNETVTLESTTGSFISGAPNNCTYADSFGVKNNIAFSVPIPPYSTRTLSHKIRIKLVIKFENTIASYGTSTYTFTKDENDCSGLVNIKKPIIGWITDNGVEFYAFSRPLKVLAISEDETVVKSVAIGLEEGTIVYHGYTSNANKLTDSNSDGIPNSIVSVEALCKRISTVLSYYMKATFAPEAVANDFGITAANTELRYAVPSGSVVKNGERVRLNPIVSANGTDSYIIPASGLLIAKGDNIACKVWDTVTVGNTTRNTWRRIKDINYSFTGDMIVENDTQSVKFTVGSATEISLKTDGFIHSKLYPVATSMALVQCKDNIVDILVNGTITLRLERGCELIKVISSPVSVYTDLGVGRFLLMSDNVFLDCNRLPFTTSRYISSGTSVRPFTAVVDVDNGVIRVISFATGTVRGYVDVSGKVTRLDNNTGSGVAQGGLQFDKTLMYNLAANMIGGDTI